MRLHLIAMAAALGVGAACASGGSSGPAAVPAAPAKSDVEMATFAPSLGVHLESMTKRPSGLYIQNTVIGTGAVAILGRSAVVRYAGHLTDGTLFDGGTTASEITVRLGSNETIRGWEEGLPGMRVGGKRRLIVPPSLGYGARGSGPIPGNAVLVFDMELIAVH